jgi:hypothetical protein
VTANAGAPTPTAVDGNRTTRTSRTAAGPKAMADMTHDDDDFFRACSLLRTGAHTPSTSGGQGKGLSSLSGARKRQATTPQPSRLPKAPWNPARPEARTPCLRPWSEESSAAIRNAERHRQRATEALIRERTSYLAFQADSAELRRKSRAAETRCKAAETRSGYLEDVRDRWVGQYYDTEEGRAEPQAPRHALPRRHVTCRSTRTKSTWTARVTPP